MLIYIIWSWLFCRWPLTAPNVKSSLAFSQQFWSSCSVMSLRLQALFIFLLMLSVLHCCPHDSKIAAQLQTSHTQTTKSKSKQERRAESTSSCSSPFIFQKFPSWLLFSLLSQWPQLCHLSPLNQSLQKKDGYFHWIEHSQLAPGVGGNPLSLSILVPSLWIIFLLVKIRERWLLVRNQ